MSAKSEIMDRVRSALTDVPDSPPAEDVDVPWQYGQPVSLPAGEVLDVFVERVEDYHATVVSCAADELPAAVAAGLIEIGAATAVVPVGVDRDWLAAAGDIEFTIEDDVPLSSGKLNTLDAVVTASAVSIAETGTIVLDHSADQGRRALTLVPDRHVCVVHADQVVSGVPEAVARLRGAVEAGQPLTWISGPSATSDIELSRVEGVHGPRRLYVILVREGN